MGGDNPLMGVGPPPSLPILENPDKSTVKTYSKLIQNHNLFVFQWMVDGLAKFGHKMTKMPIGGSTVQAILVDRETGDITANADFRKGGTVEGL